jgi:hypothetical protein
VASRKNPITAGLTAEPNSPTALIRPIPAGRAASDTQDCGKVQNVLIAQNAPETVKIRPTSRNSGSGK